MIRIAVINQGDAGFVSLCDSSSGETLSCLPTKVHDVEDVTDDEIKLLIEMAKLGIMNRESKEV